MSDVASTFRHTLRKARGRSWAELRERAAQAIAAELERRGVTRLVGEPSDAAFWRTVRPGIANAVGRDGLQLAAHFTRRSSPVFFAGVSEAAATTEYIQLNNAGAVAATLTAAERIRRGEFDLLGYTGLSFGDPIDWHLDPVNRIRSPRSHWSRIRYLDPAVSGDHKVVWELNRHQHFMVLGRAYQLSRREEFVTTFVEQVTSWMDDNPPKEGVNWASSLEIAYRLIAWVWSLELFRGSPGVTPQLQLRMLKYLYAHATHLERYLSTYFSPNTHLTGEALGLFYAGVMLPEFKGARRWAQRGWAILIEEIGRQVHADGVYFEQATYYERYTADIYLHALLLATRNQWPIPQSLFDRFKSLIKHLADVARPDGSLPMIGDDDGGRVVMLEERRCDDVRATLATASVVCGQSVSPKIANCAPQEALWLLGVTGARELRARSQENPPEGSTAYPTGGYVIMRDGWHDASNHAVIHCGPHGGKSSGHSHADALAIDLTVRGCPLLVDPGTFNYTVLPAARDHFRSTAAHNTLSMDGASSSTPAGPFSWQTRTDGSLDAWWTSTSLNYFAGTHLGFERLVGGAVHQRRVLFVKESYWVIWDSVAAPAPHEATVHFHTAPGTRVERISPRSALLRRAYNGTQVQAVLAATGTIDRVEWESDWVSECYGQRVLAPACRISTTRAGRRDIISVVAPTAADDVEIQSTEVPGGYLVAINRPEWADVVVIRTGTSVASSDISTDAELAWIRRAEHFGPPKAAALIKGCFLNATDVSIALSRPDNTEQVRTSTGWRDPEAPGFDADPIAHPIVARPREP